LFGSDRSAQLISPFFKGLFPTEVNQSANYNDFDQQAHTRQGWQKVLSEVNPILRLRTR
jgi:hypothetical protein